MICIPASTLVPSHVFLIEKHSPVCVSCVSPFKRSQMLKARKITPPCRVLPRVFSNWKPLAFQADHQWLDGCVATHCLDASHHSCGNVVATGNAAENVHEDGLHLRESEIDLHM